MAHETSHIPTLQGPGFDEIRKDVPENSSALLLVADPGDVDAMVRHSPKAGARAADHVPDACKKPSRRVGLPRSRRDCRYHLVSLLRFVFARV